MKTVQVNNELLKTEQSGQEDSGYEDIIDSISKLNVSSGYYSDDEDNSTAECKSGQSNLEEKPVKISNKQNIEKSVAKDPSRVTIKSKSLDEADNDSTQEEETSNSSQDTDTSTIQNKSTLENDDHDQKEKEEEVGGGVVRARASDKEQTSVKDTNASDDDNEFDKVELTGTKSNSKLGSKTPVNPVSTTEEKGNKKFYIERNPCRESRDTYLRNRYTPFTSHNRGDQPNYMMRNQAQHQQYSENQHSYSPTISPTTYLGEENIHSLDKFNSNTSSLSYQHPSNANISPHFVSHNFSISQNNLSSHYSPHPQLPNQKTDETKKLQGSVFDHNVKQSDLTSSEIGSQNISWLNQANDFTQYPNFTSPFSSGLVLPPDGRYRTGDVHPSPNYASSPESIASYPIEQSYCFAQTPTPPIDTSPNPAIAQELAISQIFPEFQDLQQYPDDTVNSQTDSEAIFQTIKSVTYEHDNPEIAPNYQHILKDLNSTNFTKYDFNDIHTDGSLAIERLEQELTLSSEFDPKKSWDFTNEAEIPKFRLVKTNNDCRPPAQVIIKKLCKEPAFTKAVTIIAPQTNEALCKQDNDGDSVLMICVSKPSESDSYYENLYTLTERLKQINLCCGKVVSNGSCSKCGSSDSTNFSTPLSVKNNTGDTALSCAIKLGHPQEVIDYLSQSIMSCPKDALTVFCESSKEFFIKHLVNYPSLIKFV